MDGGGREPMIVTASGPSRGRENYSPVPRVAVREAIKDLRRRIDADRNFAMQTRLFLLIICIF